MDYEKIVGHDYKYNLARFLAKHAVIYFTCHHISTLTVTEGILRVLQTNV